MIESEGTYILGSNLLNGKPFWLQTTGTQAIWYDKVWKNWKIGEKSYLGSARGANFLTSKGTGETAEPHEVSTWKYFSNGAWIASTDINIFSSNGKGKTFLLLGTYSLLP